MARGNVSNGTRFVEIAARLRALAPKAAQDKCDGNHGGPPCADPECWSKET